MTPADFHALNERRIRLADRFFDSDDLTPDERAELDRLNDAAAAHLGTLGSVIHTLCALMAKVETQRKETAQGPSSDPWAGL